MFRGSKLGLKTRKINSNYNKRNIQKQSLSPYLSFVRLRVGTLMGKRWVWAGISIGETLSWSCGELGLREDGVKVRER